MEAINYPQGGEHWSAPDLTWHLDNTSPFCVCGGGEGEGVSRTAQQPFLKQSVSFQRLHVALYQSAGHTDAFSSALKVQVVVCSCSVTEGAVLPGLSL